MSRNVEFKRSVAEAYDRVAEAYLRQRATKEPETTYLERLLDGLPEPASVLDLGCGAGVFSGYVSDRNDVLGIDISSRQIALARQRIPNASFAIADMGSVAFREGSFDAIVALYSIIHLPRTEHEPLLQRMFGWLRPGGRTLAVLGSQDWQGKEQDWLVEGVEMLWSHYGADINLEIAKEAGFSVIEASVEPDPMGGAHLYLLAEKPA